MKRRSEKCIKDELAKKHACYVLITCDPPSCDGKMHVQMSYEGDATLAAYILHGAQLHLDKSEIPADGPVAQESKIHYLK